MVYLLLVLESSQNKKYYRKGLFNLDGSLCHHGPCSPSFLVVVVNRWVHFINLINGQQNTLQCELIDWLAHVSQKMLDEPQGHVRAQIHVLLAQKLEYPLWKLVALIVSIVPGIGKNHQSVIGLGSNDPSDALGGLAQGIEIEKILLPNLVMSLEVLQPGPQDVGEGVLKGHPEHDYGATVMAIKIDALRDFPSGHTEENSTSSGVAGAAVVVEGKRGLDDILGFYEYQLGFGEVAEDAHAVPLANDGFHVAVGGEERDDAVGDAGAEFDEYGAVVADHAKVAPVVVFGRDGELIGSPSDDERADAGPEGGHGERFGDSGFKLEEFWVQIDGR